MNLPFFSKEIKLSPNERLLIIESLSIMLAAGIPILEAFDSIAEDAVNKKAKRLATEISGEISKGKTLSQAMAGYPKIFDQVFLNIVKSGEESGNLDKVLSQAAEDLKANIDTVSNIRSALFYPILVIVVLIGVTFYMFAFSLPQIADVFLDLRIKLPAYSAFILNSSVFFSKNLNFFVLGFAVFGLFTFWLFTVSKVRRFFFLILMKLPLINSLVNYIDFSRFSTTVSLLLKAGVPIIEVLDISKKVVISPKMRVDVGLVRNLLTEGSTISDAMKKHPQSFPSLIRRLIAVGEETGGLDKSFDEISKYYEKKYMDIVKNLTVLLEPILLVLIAVVVGVVLISIIVPIYQGIAQFGPRPGL